MLHAQPNHIEVDISFICERVMSKKLKIQHVHLYAQIKYFDYASTINCFLRVKNQTQNCFSHSIEFYPLLI